MEHLEQLQSRCTYVSLACNNGIDELARTPNSMHCGTVHSSVNHNAFINGITREIQLKVKNTSLYFSILKFVSQLTIITVVS